MTVEFAGEKKLYNVGYVYRIWIEEKKMDILVRLNLFLVGVMKAPLNCKWLPI